MGPLSKQQTAAANSSKRPRGHAPPPPSLLKYGIHECNPPLDPLRRSFARANQTSFVGYNAYAAEPVLHELFLTSEHRTLE